MAQGPVKAEITLGLRKDVTLAQLLPTMMQPHLILDMVSLKSDVSLPDEWVGDKGRLLRPLFPGMQTGLFVREGKNLTHRAETRNGKLFLNGREVKLES